MRGIDQGVELDPDRGGTAGAGMHDFLLDAFDQPAAQRERRHGQLFQRIGLGIAGDEIEQLRGVAPQRRIGARTATGRCKSWRCLGMIIAGAEMAHRCASWPPSRRTTRLILAWVLSAMKP